MKDKIFELIEQEKQRQEETLMMIPSENYASWAVREAVGSVLMNKYAEGQVGKRYYQGNKVIDEVEKLCKQRALAAFGLDENEWGVNVQAHSGSPANLAVYRALLDQGDRILAMHLTDGGHLSHGWKLPSKKISISSLFWESDFYHVNPETDVFDYDELAKKAESFRPKLLIAGGTAYPREIDHKRMGEIAHGVGAYYLADVAHEAGLIAAGVNESPFESADVVTMTTHKTLRGPRGALIFSRKNTKVMSHESGVESTNLNGLVDFSVFPGIQGGPHIHSIAGIAVALEEAMQPEFVDYSKKVVENAQELAKGLMNRGFDVVSGGTDKHLVLVDLRNKDQSGWVLAWALEAAGIITNRNTVPGETASPFYPSGLRMGTPGITTRGMGLEEIRVVVDWLERVFVAVKDEKLPENKDERKDWTNEFVKRVKNIDELLKIKDEVRQLCARFPINNLEE